MTGHHRRNDDWVGRALDAIAPQLDAIVGSVGVQAITEFGIDVARIHWDMTSISLYGAYPHPDREFIEPRFGHQKDRRPDLLQIQAGLAVTADGGIPIWRHAYKGGAGEVAQVISAMEALSKIAGERRFLMVGDSKLVSYANLTAMIQAGVDFIAPASKTYVGADVLADCNFESAEIVEYVGQRDTNKSPDNRESYRISKICLKARSPVAPKKTNASDRSEPHRLFALFAVPAEAEAHGREHLVGEVALTPGGEPGVQRGGQHRRRRREIDGRDARPSSIVLRRNRTRDLRSRRGLSRTRRMAQELRTTVSNAVA